MVMPGQGSENGNGHERARAFAGFQTEREQFAFFPQGDITAAEVAEAMNFLLFAVTSGGQVPAEVVLKVFNGLPAEVQRHFARKQKSGIVLAR